jgi:hypothetical protein
MDPLQDYVTAPFIGGALIDSVRDMLNIPFGKKEQRAYKIAAGLLTLANRPRIRGLIKDGDKLAIRQATAEEVRRIEQGTLNYQEIGDPYAEP